MASTLTHTQTRSVQAGPLYRVQDQVTASETIDDAVFVFRTDTQEFDHVATVDDMSAYPDTLAEAQADELEFYRLTSVTKDWEALEDAEEFGAMLIERMKALCVDYDAAVTSFVGTTTATISS